MTLLDGETERRWAHATWQISNSLAATMAASATLFIAALAFATKELPIPPNNYQPSFFEFRAKFTNSTPILLSEAILAKNDATHPLHVIYTKTHVRYDFGGTYFNHCFLLPYLKGFHLPSLLHAMSMSIAVQTCIRSAILIAASFRVGTVLVRCVEVSKLTESRRRWRRTWRVYTTVTVVAELLTSTFAMLVACLHIDNDTKNVALKFLLWRAPLAFAVCFFVSSAMFSFLELGDPMKEWKTCWFRARAFILTTFCCCFPTVYQNYLRSLKSKTCHNHVEGFVALCEYVCIGCVALFQYSQLDDVRQLEGTLSCSLEETLEQPSADVFEPAFRESPKRVEKFPTSIIVVYD